MSAVLVLAGVALLVLPGAAASTARRLRPNEWAALNRVSLRLGLWVVQLGLVLTAAPTVLRAAGVNSFAEACHRVLDPILPGGATTGWVSAAASLALGARALAARRRARLGQRTARIDDWLGEHTQVSGATLVVLPTEVVVAYAVPGPPPQVVLSRRLTRSLLPDELDAVIRHELAHLRNRHHRDLVLGATVDSTLGWVPGARASTAALCLSIERCADEEAGARPGERDSIRRALLKTTATMLGPLPAFSAAFTLLARLDALDTLPADPPLGPRAAVFVPVVGLVAVATACLLGWIVYTHHGVIGRVGFCPL